MQLHTVRANKPGREKRTRVGRGGKRGTTSGKGTKGQKSRSGRRIRPAVRDLIQRLPKKRGYANKPIFDSATVINLPDLEKVIGTINFISLEKAKLIEAGVRKVKILANGEIKKAVTIEGIKISESAKKKIEAAGGTVK